MISQHLNIQEIYTKLTEEEGVSYKEFIQISKGLARHPEAAQLVAPLRAKLEQIVSNPPYPESAIGMAVALSQLKDAQTAPLILSIMEQEQDTFFVAECVWCMSSIGEKAFRQGLEKYLHLRGIAREAREKGSTSPRYPMLNPIHLESHPVAAAEVFLEALADPNYKDPWPIPDEMVGLVRLDDFRYFINKAPEEAAKHPILSRVAEFLTNNEARMGPDHPAYRGAAYVLVMAYPLKEKLALFTEQLGEAGKKAVEIELSIYWERYK
jgi:hypothetical protein